MTAEVGAKAAQLRRRILFGRPLETGAQVVTEASGEQALLTGIGGDELRLPLVNDLQLVLDVAQEQVGFGERGRLSPLEKPDVGERAQRLERGAAAQPLVASSVNELQRLRDELDLADSPRPELDVPVEAGA